MKSINKKVNENSAF